MQTRRDWLIGIGSVGLTSLLPAAATKSDWPQFRGPVRNGSSPGTGLARKWPASGPRLLWSVPVAQGTPATARSVQPYKSGAQEDRPVHVRPQHENR